MNANAGSNSHKCLKASIELLASVMRAPMESNGCVWRINNAVECVNVGLRFDRHELEAQTKFASQQSELLRAAVHFLTRCRTIDEHRQMVSHFCACRCNMNIKRVRDLHKRCPRRLSQFGTSAKAGMASGLFNVSPDVVIAQMADLMVEFINFALVKMTPNRFHTSKWPNSPQDLLPFGIDHTICALHHWAIEPAPLERNMAYRMAYLFSLVYDAFAHELCQPLEDGSFKHDLPFVMAILHFGEILDEFDDDLEKAAALGLPMPPIADLRYAAPTSREVIKRVDQFCGAVLRTWFMIQHAKGRMVMGGGNLTLVLSTNDDRFKPILDRLSLVCRRADPSSEIGHIPLEIGRLEESGPRGRRTRSSSSSNSDPADSIFNKSYSEKLGITWVHLLSVRSWGCLYPHCPLSVADGMNTRLCAKCGLIPYCGTDCQKKAWKDPRMPHKKMCSSIVGLRDCLGQETWDKILSQREITTITDFERVCREKNVYEDVIVFLGIQLGILQLGKAKRRSGNLLT